MSIEWSRMQKVS